MIEPRRDPPLSPPLARGLSARILALTVLCLLIGEILIFVPSIARYRLAYLEERIAQAHLATLVPASTTEPIDKALEEAMLRHTGAAAITVISDAPELMLGAMVNADAHFNLAQNSPLELIEDAFESLLIGGERMIAVSGMPATAPDTEIEVILSEAPMVEAMIDYGIRILILSLVLSVIVASLIFFALQRLMVNPLVRVTAQLSHFRSHPEDESRLQPPSKRQDEIGIVAYETSRMQRDLRVALAQKTRLAGLGEAVSKLNHDLRNILSTAILITDRLEHSADPDVRAASPRLTLALERALKLCGATLDYAKSRPRPLQLEPVPIGTLIDNVIRDVDPAPSGIVAVNGVTEPHCLTVDHDELHRVLLNLTHNAIKAMAGGGQLTFQQSVDPNTPAAFVLDVTDTGSGLPDAKRGGLFDPFANASANGDGAGLGLAIAHEIMKRHGGSLNLKQTGPQGTTFTLVFPVWSGSAAKI